MTDNIVKQNEIYHVELAVPLDVKKYFGKVKETSNEIDGSEEYQDIKAMRVSLVFA